MPCVCVHVCVTYFAPRSLGAIIAETGNWEREVSLLAWHDFVSLRVVGVPLYQKGVSWACAWGAGERGEIVEVVLVTGSVCTLG